MEPHERTIVYGLVGACICGIIIVGAFLIFTGGMFSSGSGFSELYFEDHQKLPTIINENDPVNFSFTVVTHNKENTDYSYEVFAGNQTVRSGSFTLPFTDASYGTNQQKNNKTVIIEDIVLKSSLMKVDESQVYETRITDYNGLGHIQSCNGRDSQATDSSKLCYAVQLPGSSGLTTLFFDPDAHETFNTTTTSKTTIGDINTIQNDDKAVEINGYRPSKVGFDVSEVDWTIKNDLGIISTSSKTTTTRYRHAFEKVSVNVSASPVSNPDKTSYYDIHFWVFAKSPSQQ
jgi:hypothetical protein